MLFPAVPVLLILSGLTSRASVAVLASESDPNVGVGSASCTLGAVSFWVGILAELIVTVCRLGDIRVLRQVRAWLSKHRLAGSWGRKSRRCYLSDSIHTFGSAPLVLRVQAGRTSPKRITGGDLRCVSRSTGYCTSGAWIRCAAISSLCRYRTPATTRVGTHPTSTMTVRCGRRALFVANDDRLGPHRRHKLIVFGRFLTYSRNNVPDDAVVLIDFVGCRKFQPVKQLIHRFVV